MKKIGIVVSEFNSAITSKMLGTAQAYAQKLGLKAERVISVPGAFDMPLAIKALLERSDIEGVATLGAIITGETSHDEIIAAALAKTIHDLQLEFNKPVSLGVSGPGMTEKQAKERAEEYAKRSVDALAKMIAVLEK
ncbi:MAG: 6,7-dimethyl-8-ribityllumazine synthase [Candidatus Diapherotrites archaeon]|nr:6,7-dimethyl-8-ribityllumazine synthase [Candidatus Diapherotrites archaeon]